MKQGWEIKKIGDICDIKTGKLDANASSENGQYPFFTCSVEPLKIDYYAYDCECVLIAGNGDLNVKYYNGKFNAYQRTYIITTKTEVKNICVKYLYKFFSAYIEQLRKLSIGSVIKYIKLGNLTDAVILIPSLEEQERIVEVLDREFEKIDAMKANAEQNLQHAKDLFQAVLRKELQPKDGWETKTIKELSEELFAGGDVPKLALSRTITEEYNVPIYANAVERNGLYGYTNVARVIKPSLTIAGRGSGTGHIIERNEQYLPVVRLIVIVPQAQLVRVRFLYYALHSLDIKSNGSAIPQLTVPMIAQYHISFPNLTIQDTIIDTLDYLNERCKALEENYKKTIALCDDMKHALLRKAFNGEL